MSISTWIINRVPALLVSWSFRKVFGRRDIVVFSRLLELPKWKQVSYEDPQKWIFEDDNSFVIEKSSESVDFTEQWTKRFPDKRSFAVEIFLKINGERVDAPLTFIGVDGWRYFVPRPEIEKAYDKIYYYWDIDSIEYKVFKVIGSIDYKFDSLEKFGKECGVEIN